MNIQQKKDFLINCAYWAVIAGAGFVAFKYLVPICMPVILGILVAWMVVSASRKLHCTHKVLRICISLVIYGLIGLLVGILAVRTVSGVSGLLKWLPEVYEMKLKPLAALCYSWIRDTTDHLDPAVLAALEKVIGALTSALESLFAVVSQQAVNLVSGIATGVPSLVLSILAMIFSTIFLVGDYERIAEFTGTHVPQNVKDLWKKLKLYLRDTLFVVIRSYLAIMILTFTELSILFAVFGIEKPLLKAALIAVFDVMPILGTGGIMIPWFVTSFVLGYTPLGIKLLVIYIIVTIIRNYVEPKIVGTQLGLHPIITLAAMFVGLRAFGFWGLFGLPVGISFLWKQKQEREAKEIETA